MQIVERHSENCYSQWWEDPITMKNLVMMGGLSIGCQGEKKNIVKAALILMRQFFNFSDFLGPLKSFKWRLRSSQPQNKPVY